MRVSQHRHNQRHFVFYPYVCIHLFQPLINSDSTPAVSDSWGPQKAGLHLMVFIPVWFVIRDPARFILWKRSYLFSFYYLCSSCLTLAASQLVQSVVRRLQGVWQRVSVRIAAMSGRKGQQLHASLMRSTQVLVFLSPISRHYLVAIFPFSISCCQLNVSYLHSSGQFYYTEFQASFFFLPLVAAP